MVSIGFTGDFCPWERMEHAFLSGTWQAGLSDVKPFFDSNDLNIIDLECPLTNEQEGIVKTGPYIKALPETASILKWLNCKMVATANNHFKDYGEKGMKDTYEALNKQGIEWIGSGENFKEASKVSVKIIEGLRFAFINLAENEWTTTTGDYSGCNPLDAINAYYNIKEYKKDVDFVIVIVHGGHEHYELPSPRMKKMYRYFIDAGADAVIGHHTHIVSGFEKYKGKPIFYSLGNFCFDWKGLRNGTWNIGLLLKLKFTQNKEVDFEYHFVEQNNETPGVKYLSEKKREEYESNIIKLNEVIANDRLLETKFKDYVSKLNTITISRLQPYNSRILTALYKRNLIPDFLHKKKKILLTNLIRCESHREVLLEILKHNSN